MMANQRRRSNIPKEPAEKQAKSQQNQYPMPALQKQLWRNQQTESRAQALKPKAHEKTLKPDYIISKISSPQEGNF